MGNNMTNSPEGGRGGGSGWTIRRNIKSCMDGIKSPFFTQLFGNTI